MVCDRTKSEENDWVRPNIRWNDWVKGGGGGGGPTKFWDLRSDFRDFLGPKGKKCLFAPQAQWKLQWMYQKTSMSQETQVLFFEDWNTVKTVSIGQYPMQISSTEDIVGERTCGKIVGHLTNVVKDKQESNPLSVQESTNWISVDISALRILIQSNFWFFTSSKLMLWFSSIERCREIHGSWSLPGTHRLCLNCKKVPHREVKK